MQGCHLNSSPNYYLETPNVSLFVSKKVREFTPPMRIPEHLLQTCLPHLIQSGLRIGSHAMQCKPRSEFLFLRAWTLGVAAKSDS